MIDPYTTWGIEPEQLRAGVAAFIRAAAGVAALLFLASALTVYWEADNRRGWKGLAFTAALLFFAGTALARVIWIQFYVLS